MPVSTISETHLKQNQNLVIIHVTAILGMVDRESKQNSLETSPTHARKERCITLNKTH